MYRIVKDSIDFKATNYIHYNFVREYDSIKKTPAEQAGIKLELGQNKIESPIKLASKN